MKYICVTQILLLPAIYSNTDDRTSLATYLNRPIGIDTDIHDTVTALIGCQNDFCYPPQPLVLDLVDRVST
jgi:hypothetical protein